MNINRPAWQAQAACRNSHPDVFYNPKHEARAKVICARCPVLKVCRDFAIREMEPEGVWGGMNLAEREAAGQKVVDMRSFRRAI